MAAVGFWEGIVRTIRGRGMLGGEFQFRLVAQPLLALLLGIRFGLRDAKRGRKPFLLRVFSGKDGLAALQRGLCDAIVPLGVAFVVDGILQWLILGRVRPIPAVLVGGLLVFPPFVLGRGIANRVRR